MMTHTEGDLLDWRSTSDCLMGLFGDHVETTGPGQVLLTPAHMEDSPLFLPPTRLWANVIIGWELIYSVLLLILSIPLIYEQIPVPQLTICVFNTVPTQYQYRSGVGVAYQTPTVDSSRVKPCV